MTDVSNQGESKDNFVPVRQHQDQAGVDKFSWLLWFYEVAFLAAWVVVIIVNRYNIYSTYPMEGSWSLYISIPLSVVVGSMSAASFAIYGMYKHRIKQDFGMNYVAWYISKPIVGGTMGGFIGLISTVILNSFGADTPVSHATFIGIAFLAGSNDKFTAQMIEKFADKMLGGRSSSSKDDNGSEGKES